MANYYIQVTPEDGLPCSEGEANDIQALLDEATDEDLNHGFRFAYAAGEGYLEAEESGDWDQLPEAALVKLGALIARAGKPYLEFGAAFTCSKLRPGSHGGAYFRISADGRVIQPTVTWPEA